MMSRCSSLRAKSMSATSGWRESGRRRTQLRKPMAQLLVHRRSLCGLRVDVQMCLLAGGYQSVVAPTIEPMLHRETLVIHRQHLGRRVQRLTDLYLGKICDMRIDRVQHAAARTVSRIDAYPSVERLGRLTEHLQITIVRHMAVVIDPFGAHASVDPRQLIGNPVRANALRSVRIKPLLKS